MIKYWKDYKWSNVLAMIRNLKLDPKICIDDFHGRLVVITGATSGIGYASARKFASHGADLLVINRDEIKTKELVDELSKEFNTNCSYIIADFSSLSDVHQAAEQLSRNERNIDVLIHNAGLYLTKRNLTVDNNEEVFQTNYLSTFILNYYLREKLINQKNGRILFVNSEAYRFAAFGIHLDDLNWSNHSYSGIKSYSTAKMAQLLSMMKFKEYFQNSNITINAMHPGNVRTNSGQSNGWLYKIFKKKVIDRGAIPLSISAEALYYLGVSVDLDNVSGKFYNLTTEEELAPPALDKDEAEKLWMISMKLGGFNG
ncbi:MAG: SDR family NAD(P)-dependent oxidoreductase [Anaerolineaceae bacterium]|nr:SDR family NAD(P)-dependent oxidoreductase [Anaerolineaceae bacterium]